MWDINVICLKKAIVELYMVMIEDFLIRKINQK